MNNFKCRVCGDSESYKTIFESESPFAANVLECPSVDMEKYPLHVVMCNQCGHVQLYETLDASFYGDYLYTPSFARGFIEYIDELAVGLNKYVDKPKKKALEVGSSNGYFLSKLKELDWEVLGVEPSEYLCNEAIQNGVPTYCGYFGKGTINEIQNQIRNPDVLIFRHVMEHLDKLDEIAEGIKEILNNGILLVEVPYLKKIIEEDQFYAFFHEHLSYYSVTALYKLFSKAGIYIHHIYENTLEGGSVLIVADNKKIVSKWDNITAYLEDEKTSLSAEKIDSFAGRIKRKIDEIKKIVFDANEKGERVAAWGAGQRGCTLISICKFLSSELKYVIDVNENYWWKYIPGTDIQIVPPDYYKTSPIDKMIIFATGYADSIIKENQAFIHAGGEFVRII